MNYGSRRPRALFFFLLTAVVTIGGCKARRAAPKATASATASASAAPSAAPTATMSRMPPPAAPAQAQIPPPADVASPPADAEKTPSGLMSKVLTKGQGSAHPSDEDKVKVHYTGWTANGQMFDSSVPRGQPASFGVTRVIKGWTEGLKLMVTGEKRRFWIPGELAYGNEPRHGRPSGQLTFDVELIEIIEGPKPPETPEDVKAAPASAKKTASGLRYRVLKKGVGTAHPKATSRVQVHYSGWTTDGKMFDSSVMRGQPTAFGLNQVVKGWTEGVQLMVEGEKARFWIPGSLAYGDKPSRPGAPAGTLVFDIELLKILE